MFWFDQVGEQGAITNPPWRMCATVVTSMFFYPTNSGTGNA